MSFSLFSSPTEPEPSSPSLSPSSIPTACLTTDEDTMLSNVAWLQKRLADAFPHASVEVHDTRGDDQHLAVTLQGAVFQNLSRMEAHRLVYEALHHMRGGRIHALSIKTNRV